MSAAATPTGDSGDSGAVSWPRVRDRDGYEYAHGSWAKIPLGAESNWTAFRALVSLMDQIVDARGGVALPGGCALQIWPNAPKSYRRPDGSYFPPGRLPDDRVPSGMVNVPPDLVIEALSPTDKGADMFAKVEEYFEVGVRLVWLLFPKTRTVLAIHSDGRALRLTENATLTGEDVIPGFAIPVAELFQR
ncbi:MAG: Uma2 family endonuclease [Dehalococcoidia bacterium]